MSPSRPAPSHSGSYGEVTGAPASGQGLTQEIDMAVFRILEAKAVAGLLPCPA